MGEPENGSEEPTEHRLAEARRRGFVVVSGDLQTGLTALAICIALMLGGRSWLAGLLAHLRSSLALACSQREFMGAGRASFQALTEVLTIPLGIALAVAVVVGITQTRGLFSPHVLRFDFGRILPFSRRSKRIGFWAETGKVLGKATVAVALAWWTMRPILAGVVHLTGEPAGRTLSVLSTLAVNLGLRLAVAAVVLGVADYFWLSHRYRKSLRMTRDEVRRELKEREGDPRLKSAREQVRTELLQQHAMDEVRRARLVVAGEIWAVALRYQTGDSGAPVVVCKGERLMATRIVQVAREANVSVIDHSVLAATLAKVDEHCEIPEASHEAVARLIAAAHD